MLDHRQGILLLVVAVCLATSFDSARAQEACAVDAATGLTVPTRATGVCVGDLGGDEVLVQRNRQGLFVVALGTAGTVTAEWTGEVHRSSARVVYCPASLLDFARGTPGADCLIPGASLRPGPGALVGAGSVQARLRGDGEGRPACPSSSRVVASLVSGAGERFEVTGAVRLAPSDEASNCVAGYDRVELEYRSEPETPAAAVSDADLSPERRQRLARLMELDEEQWRAVELMLTLTPDDWALLQAIVEEGGAAATPGTAVPAPSGASDFAGAAPSPPPVEAKVQSITAILNAIVARLDAVRKNAADLVNRIPDRPDVRALVGQIDLGQLRGVMDQVRDTLQGLVDVARELRAGFDAFDAPEFRRRLGGVLDDLERATLLYQQLLCLDNPDITPRAVPTALLRRLLDRVPPLILYGLSRALDAIRDDWDTALGTIVDAVPAELTQFCNEGVATRALAFEPESAICVALRPTRTKKALVEAEADAGVFLLLMNFAKNRTDEQIAVTAGANVVAGATVGTVVKNPAYETLEGLIEKAEKVKEVLDKLVDRRKDCLETDADIESDLRDCAKDGCACSVPLSFVVDDVAPSYTYAARLVEKRIDQAELAGVGDPATARTFYATAEDDANVGTAAGYTALCQAYAALLPSTAPPGAGGTPTARVPESPSEVISPSRRPARRP